MGIPVCHCVSHGQLFETSRASRVLAIYIKLKRQTPLPKKIARKTRISLSISKIKLFGA